MATINFPAGAVTGDSLVTVSNDGVSTSWTFNGRSWVKNITHLPEAPINGSEYARIDETWGLITHPIPADVPAGPGQYARIDGGWQAADFTAAGPDPALNDAGVLYGIRDGVWNIILATDFNIDVYSKTESDVITDALESSKAPVAHTHMYADLIELGLMAKEADTGIDGLQYVRKDNAWAELVPLEIEKKRDSISIVDPLFDDDALLFFTSVQLTVEDLYAVNDTVASSVPWNVLVSTTADESGGLGTNMMNSEQIANNPAGVGVTPDNPVIPANSWVRLVIGTPAGGPSFFHLSMISTQM